MSGNENEEGGGEERRTSIDEGTRARCEWGASCRSRGVCIRGRRSDHLSPLAHYSPRVRRFWQLRNSGNWACFYDINSMALYAAGVTWDAKNRFRFGSRGGRGTKGRA